MIKDARRYLCENRRFCACDQYQNDWFYISDTQRVVSTWVLIPLLIYFVKRSRRRDVNIPDVIISLWRLMILAWSVPSEVYDSVNPNKSSSHISKFKKKNWSPYSLAIRRAQNCHFWHHEGPENEDYYSNASRWANASSTHTHLLYFISVEKLPYEYSTHEVSGVAFKLIRHLSIREIIDFIKRQNLQ